MLRLTLIAAAIGCAVGPSLAAANDPANVSPFDPNVEDLSVRSEPPMMGIHWTREQHGARVARDAAEAAAARAARRSPNMTYHGGKIATTAVVKAIFWGPSWANATFVGDKIGGLDSWYTGHSGSNYAKTVDEYTDTVGGGHQVGATTTYQGHVVDTSTATGGSSTSAILAQVCKLVTSGAITPDPQGNGYYPVYTDVKRGSAGYCAWHSAGSCGGTPVQFAFFFNLDGDSGCNPADTQTGHSQGLAALANVTAHELAEARSDPASPGAWYDSSGAENGDKCAWTFNVPFVTFTNGTIWKLQGEWSNVAYTAGTGYANSSGQKGASTGTDRASPSCDGGLPVRIPPMPRAWHPRSMKARSISMLCLWLAAGFVPAAGAERPPRGTAAATWFVPVAATRTVSQYLERERALAQAIEAGDRAGIVAMVAPDFTLRTPESADVVGRDEWLGRELATHGHRHFVRDLSVREADDVAVVSFVLDVGTGARRASWFVVDVWKASSGQLLARHEAQPKRIAPPPSRPSGRE